jgi:hypothetical protein
MNLIWHGSNRKQCFYRPNCLVCVVKMLALIVMIRLEVALK